MKSISNKIKNIEASSLSMNQGDFDIKFVDNYLAQSAIRVLHLTNLLERNGVTSGRILDVGAYLGTFAVPLRKLGFEVTAIDTFSRFDGALEPSMNLMENLGIQLVNVDSVSNFKIPSDLGHFDVVIAMAVIEHIPHTPKYFLEMCLGHVKRESGWLIVDTPNVTRFWNRKNLFKGDPIMMPIEGQYHSEIPFTGHHREFTLNEVKWMFGELGLEEISGHWFDYNLFQFSELSREHINAMLTWLMDPSQMDTLMVMGRRT